MISFNPPPYVQANAPPTCPPQGIESQWGRQRLYHFLRKIAGYYRTSRLKLWFNFSGPLEPLNPTYTYDPACARGWMGVPTEWCCATVLTMCQLLLALAWCCIRSSLRARPGKIGRLGAEFWGSLATGVYAAVAVMGGSFSLLSALPLGIPSWAQASATGLWFLSSLVAMRAWRYVE